MGGHGLNGVKNGNWKGGRVIDPRGYVLIRVGIGHPLADCRGYAYEHRLVASAAPGEHILRSGEKRRRRDTSNPLVDCACGCGQSLRRFDKWHRRRSFVTGHNSNRDLETGRWLTKAK
jgi:hypothetical protein